MSIDSFLEFLEQKKISGSPLITFSARGYPLSLYHQLARAISQVQRRPLSVLASEDVEEVIKVLSMSFLGELSVFFVPDVALFNAVEQKKLQAFFLDQGSPHTVVLASSEMGFEPTYADFSLSFEERLDGVIANRLARFLFVQESDQLFFEPIALQDFMAVSMALLLAKDLDGDMRDLYIRRLVSSEESIFSLAQFWLEKNSRDFAVLWGGMRGLYPVEYWVSFFSDLLWQASYCIEREGKGLERSLSNRLPFSFTRRDWRKYGLRELAAAHAKLYEFDWQSKNGGSPQQLDLFVMQFMNNCFALHSSKAKK